MLPTTAAVLEILIIGMQTVAALGLALGAILGGGGLWLRVFDLPDAFVIAVLGLIAYALGVVVDRVADNLDALWRAELKGDLPPIPIMRLRMMQVDDGRSRFLEYQRSRLRIARATTVNAFLVAGMGLWFMSVRTGLGAAQILGVEVAVLAVMVGAFLSARLIGQAYDRRLGDAYSMWARDNPTSADMERRVGLTKLKSKREGRNGTADSTSHCLRAAAVCYRIPEGHTEPDFYLVETSDGDRWTFPKGKLRRKEDPADAAAREAKEEAGVEGDIEGRITSYSYPAKETSSCVELRVDAFVLKVSQVGEQRRRDRHRNRGWFSPEEAKKKLSQQRHEPYTLEHTQVVDEAVAFLRRSPRTSSD